MPTPTLFVLSRIVDVLGWESGALERHEHPEEV